MSTITSYASRSDDETLNYGGPHHWQIQPWARFIRHHLRQREYFRWVEQYCTSVKVRGQDRLANLDGPVIIIANHQSHMDTPVLMSAMPKDVQDNLYFGAAADRWFVKGKRKLILQPWYQSLGMGNFPIVRGGGSKTLDYARWLLDQRCNICIFPEGTRATDSKLGKFRHGVTLLAREHDIPVVPVVLQGLQDLRPKGARTVTPGPVSVSILEPVNLRACDSVEAGTELLWQKMNAVFFKAIPFTAPDNEVVTRAA